MRVSKAKAAENRKQIARAAARLFRERGIEATGVDAITREAGLTHGAVYSQFGSKEAIAVESVRRALRGSKRAWVQQLTHKGRKKTLPAIVESYLSGRHRDAPGTGCLVAALGGEISRQPRKVREAFTAEFKEALKFLGDLASSEDRSIEWKEALPVFAAMAGGLMLARAVSDPKLSDQILQLTRGWINRATSSENARRQRT